MKYFRSRAALFLLHVTQVCCAIDSKPVALTIAYLPVASVVQIKMRDKQQITDRILESLVRQHVKAIGLVNEDKLFEQNEVEAGISLLRMARRGHGIGQPQLRPPGVVQDTAGGIRGRT